MPRSITKHIDKLQCNFLWDTTLTKKKPHMVGWEVVTRDKAYEEVSLQQCSIKNDTMITKLA
ncbi:hypothetical protein H5410_030999 [Solanum commersonii]|uniref:Uncharacterized protein n=1 Tax=Solanum commersonii TaxID=4109 RepID=A0A9J5YHU9_SOLCO|nr:hypothetical protein H5410_030999 [Solanum commersonii]